MGLHLYRPGCRRVFFILCISRERNTSKQCDNNDINFAISSDINFAINIKVNVNVNIKVNVKVNINVNIDVDKVIVSYRRTHSHYL